MKLHILVAILLIVGSALSQETQGPKPEESPGLLERIKRQAKIFFNLFTTTTTTTTQRTLNIQIVGGAINTATGTGTGGAVYYLTANGAARRVRGRNGRVRRRRLNLGRRRARRGGRRIRFG